MEHFIQLERLSKPKLRQDLLDSSSSTFELVRLSRLSGKATYFS
jgi:hypothetical protein